MFCVYMSVVRAKTQSGPGTCWPETSVNHVHVHETSVGLFGYCILSESNDPHNCFGQCTCASW